MFRDLNRIIILLESLLSSTAADQVPPFSQFSVYDITITSPFHISVPSLINCSLSRSLRSFLIYRATLRLIQASVVHEEDLLEGTRHVREITINEQHTPGYGGSYRNQLTQDFGVQVETIFLTHSFINLYNWIVNQFRCY